MLARRHVMQAGGGVLALFLGKVNIHSSKATSVFEVSRTDAEWRRQLTPAQHSVLRQNGTEQPFSSALLAEHRRGTFNCAGCGRAAFSSAAKFESGTGWPSFWASLEGGITTESDHSFGMVRAAVHCRGCGGHLGHVFDDGPQPTGLRYCMNGVALGFRPDRA